MTFSSKRRNRWELEEKKRLPSLTGELITVNLVVEEDGFKIVINEDYHLYYYQRMDPYHADQITIAGDVLVNAVDIAYAEEEEEEEEEEVEEDHNN
ncbi:hypothetical protein GCK72_007901 [Caenorhabditis remanei]|uniref:Galectin n=2 Tax=Caenorhabditis remanei TaxID=31234 RepID=A0A6A5HLC5_CAERE|nr:hypothetical protein GCK72_007901 [Caenorhabditis remanei]KAF1767941.1 hypothetical protein GCK72_007901 [Caenorhabditis remanei]